MKTIYGNEALYNITFGTMTNIFAGLGTVLSPASTKTALSAGALLSNSERSLINESVYKTIVISSIVKKIRDDREKRRAQILANLRDPALSYANYPINVAIADVQEYHHHCSFIYGLQKALEEGTQDTKGQRVLQLKRDLDEVELQMKNRANELGLKTLSEESMSKDYLLNRLKARSDSINRELIASQTATSAASGTQSGSQKQALTDDQKKQIASALCIASEIWGSEKMTAGIKIFQATIGNEATGELTQEETTKLQKKKSPCKGDRQNYYEDTLTEDQIKKLQKALCMTETGKLDGPTREAIKKRITGLNLTPGDGTLTKEIMTKLPV
jgi:hypothetical protein